MMDSRIPGFHRLSAVERLVRVAGCLGLRPGGLDALSSPVSARALERQSEDVVGALVLPMAIAPNFRVDGRDAFVPMATEEPSVVAAAANGARLLRGGAGILTTVGDPVLTGQVLLTGVAGPDEAGARITAAFAELRDAVRNAHPSLAAAGGGLTAVRHRAVGADLLVLLDVDVRKAMGANLVNDACERIAPRLEALTGGQAILRVLSNAAERRVTTARGRVPVAELHRDPAHGVDVAGRVAAVSRFAAVDAGRAVTHNKGIFNGIDAVLAATGQDVRAVEAAGHAWAARSGRYAPLSSWRVEGDALIGELALPLAVGTVGGAIDSRPACLAALAVLGIGESRDAARLASIVAACGLAQNLAALRALADEGIGPGHLRLQARNVAAAMGATTAEVDEVVRRLAADGGGRIDRRRVEETVRRVREGKGE